MEVLLQSKVSLTDRCSEGISGMDLLESLVERKRQIARLVISNYENTEKIKEESRAEESKENVEIKEEDDETRMEKRDSFKATESPSSMAVEEIETESDNGSGRNAIKFLFYTNILKIRIKESSAESMKILNILNYHTTMKFSMITD